MGHCQDLAAAAKQAVGLPAMGVMESKEEGEDFCMRKGYEGRASRLWRSSGPKGTGSLAKARKT